MYIADGLNRIRKVTVSTGIITTIAGTGSFGFSGDGGAAVSAVFNGAYGIDLDSSGKQYCSISITALVFNTVHYAKVMCISLIYAITVSAR